MFCSPALGVQVRIGIPKPLRSGQTRLPGESRYAGPCPQPAPAPFSPYSWLSLTPRGTMPTPTSDYPNPLPIGHPLATQHVHGCMLDPGTRPRAKEGDSGPLGKESWGPLTQITVYKGRQWAPGASPVLQSLLPTGGAWAKAGAAGRSSMRTGQGLPPLSTSSLPHPPAPSPTSVLVGAVLWDISSSVLLFVPDPSRGCEATDFSSP